MIDTYSQEWRRITEARWVLRECGNRVKYYEGVLKARGQKGHDMLLRDVRRVQPHMANFTKRVAAELIAQMKQEDEDERTQELAARGHHRTVHVSELPAGRVRRKRAA